MRNENFYKTALHCGEFSDDNGDSYENACFIQTNENILRHLTDNHNLLIHRSYYLQNYPNVPNPLHWNKFLYGYGDTLPVHLQPNVYTWNDNQILSKINEGVFYALYNGHGSKGGWLAPGFTRPSVALLQNGDKLPVIFSLACLTGKYNESGDCFVERILKKENGGCVGIFAATESSLMGYDDAMALGMFDAIWPNLQLIYGFKKYDSYTAYVEPTYEMGKILDLGLLRMAETFGRGNIYNRQLITQKIYHYFGDPSMMIYTTNPQDFMEPIIRYVNGRICVQSPCDSTRITFYTPSSTQPIVDSFIGNYVEYETNADSVIVCLDKHNFVPYIQTFYKNIFIQNENINENRNYLGDQIHVGHHVTTQKPVGNVVIENANVSIQGNNVELHPGMTIIHSNVRINGH